MAKTEQAPVKSTGLGDYGLPLWTKMITAGISGSIAEIFTIPLDTAKVRLQIQGANLKPGDVPKYKGLQDTIQTIFKEEGPKALFKGLSPGLQRQMVFASIRIGLYDSVRSLVCGQGQSDPGLFKKICVGLFTGSVGIAIASPTDCVKVRLQAEGRLPPGVPKKYNGVFDAYSKIIAQEGIGGLWTGVGPNMARNAVINAAELATYDETKSFVMRNNILGDNMACHFVCSAWAGFVATVVGSPVDVIKTRMMSAKPGDYKGVVDCAVSTFKKEGVAAFYNGFAANASRIVSWNIVMFMSLAQVRRITYEKFYKH